MQKSIDTKYFTVFYDEKDNNILDSILAVFDAAYERIISTFNLKKDNASFTIHLCPDVATFKELTGKSDDEYQDWMVGNADYANRQLCILSPNVVHDRTFEDMIKVCRHEVIHIAFDQLGDPEKTNILISEGIAVAFAEQINISWLELSNYPPAERLSDENYFYENNGYLYSGVYVLYIIKKYGVDVFKNIYAGDEPLKKYLYKGFEKDAINSILLECNINNKDDEL